MEHEVLELVELLYTMVTEAWGVPLGNEKCIIERDKAIQLIDEIKARLPVELAESKRIVAAKEEFINSAKREAESIRRSAEDRARQMIDQQEIVRVAKAHSNEMLTSAEQKSRELRRAANEYIDDALRRTEEAVSAALTEIHQSRQRFRSATVVSQQGKQPQVRRVTDIDID